MTNNLDKNLELRKALAEVDRLKSENVSLDYICSQQDIIIKDLKAENVELKEKYRNISNENERNKFCSVIDRGLIDRLKKEFQSYEERKKQIKKELGYEW